MHNGSQIAAILQLQNRISTPKQKNDDFEARFERNFRGKIIGVKIQKKLFPKHLSHVSRCHYNAIYDSQLQNAVVLRMQLPQGATLTQPFHCDLQTLSFKTEQNYVQRLTNCCDFAAPKPDLFPLRSANIELQNASFRARLPSNSKSWRFENKAFVRGFLQIAKVECMKTKLSCEASFKFQELKIWKQSFRARLLSNCKSWRHENDDFVRDFLQLPRSQEVKASLQCSSSNAQSISTHAKHNSTASSKKRKSHLKPSVTLRAQNERRTNAKRRRPKPSRKRANFSPQRNLRLPEKTQCFVQILTFKSHPSFMKTKVACEASFKLQKLNVWKRSFRARHPSDSKSWRDLLRQVLTRLEDLLRQVLTRLEDLLRQVLTIDLRIS